MNIVDPGTRVIVPTTRPLETFHAPAGELTACGLPMHGWYLLSAGMAYNNVDSPCPRCFPPSGGGDPGNSGPGF